MKINYTIDNNNYITSFQRVPFNEKLPYVEVADDQQIILGVSQVINSIFYSNLDTYNNLKSLRNEKKSIYNWLVDNDWKVNKYVLGEWKSDDTRWTSYVSERLIKRERLDEINKLLGEEEG